MATVIPAPAGSGNIAQNFALLGRQLGSLGPFIQVRNLQRKQKLQHLALQQFAQKQGFQVPQNLPPEFIQNLFLQQQLIKGRAAIAQAKPIKGSFQQIADPVTGQQINALVDPTTGNIIKRFGVAGDALSPKDKTQIAVTQAREFRADPRIKNLQIIERSERGMAVALKQATSPNVKSRIASDQALGVLFQKMLDPASVVRESEFARTPEGAAAMNRLLAIAPQLRLGGLRLLDEDRQALVTMARKLLTEAKISANRAFNEFSVRADEIGLNKKIVFGGAKPFDIPTEFDSTIGVLTPAEQSRLAELERLERQ